MLYPPPPPPHAVEAEAALVRGGTIAPLSRTMCGQTRGRISSPKPDLLCLYGTPPPPHTQQIPRPCANPPPPPHTQGKSIKPAGGLAQGLGIRLFASGGAYASRHCSFLTFCGSERVLRGGGGGSIDRTIHHIINTRVHHHIMNSGAQGAEKYF